MTPSSHPPVGLPVLVGPPDLLEGRPRELWLNRVRVCRQRLLNACGLGGSAIAALVIDEVLGLMLLVRFVRERRLEALPTLGEIASEADTPAAACRLVQERATSPLLRAIFEPTAYSEDRLSPTAWSVVNAIDLSWRDRAGRTVPLPVTAFGEFHQLCLSEQDDGRPGQRRAGGVHYTPASLADYLTSRVLDPLLTSAARTPRILDPSCGGGTFLLAALTRWRQSAGGEVSAQAYLDFLGESLFGIDIDPRAVAWTRRTLLLAGWADLLAAGRSVEDTSLRVPDLRQNLICGDFLCGSRDAQQTDFDAILGGPPFVRLQEMLRVDAGRVQRYREEYLTARSGQFDLYMPFFEEALRRLRDGGRLGWSVSNTFLRSVAGRTLRSLLGRVCAVRELVELTDPKVYPDAVTQVVLVLLEKAAQAASCRHVRVAGEGGLREKLAAVWSEAAHPEVAVRELPASTFRGEPWSGVPHEKWTQG